MNEELEIIMKFKKLGVIEWVQPQANGIENELFSVQNTNFNSVNNQPLNSQEYGYNKITHIETKEVEV